MDAFISIWQRQYEIGYLLCNQVTIIRHNDVIEGNTARVIKKGGGSKAVDISR